MPLNLGTAPSLENDGKPSARATGDGDDGVTVPAIAALWGTHCLSVQVTNQDTFAATLYGWIDINLNGRFDGNEFASAVAPAGTSSGTVQLCFSVTFATSTGYFMRFRLTQDALVNSNSGTPSAEDTRSYGAASNGEVEDYFSVSPVNLPLTLLDFSGRAEQRSVLLQWSTTREMSSGYFDVEYGTDGTSWATIGTVAAKGGGEQTNRYVFRHRSPLAGNNYYRLKMVDQDGRFVYGPIVKAVWEAGRETLVLYPNPATDVVYLSGAGNIGGYQVTDLLGRVMRSGGYSPDGIAVGGMNPGHYLLRVVLEDGSVQTLRLATGR